MTTDEIEQNGAGTDILALPSREPDESNFRYLERLMQMLPAPESDGGDELIGKILGTDSLQEENDLWDSNSTARLIGHRVVFHECWARPSDQPQGLQFFLVCRITDRATGETDTLTTGSQNIVASLVRRAFLGQLPAEAEICGPKRKTEDGKVPLHLRWIGKVAQG